MEETRARTLVWPACIDLPVFWAGPAHPAERVHWCDHFIDRCRFDFIDTKTEVAIFLWLPAGVYDVKTAAGIIDPILVWCLVAGKAELEGDPGNDRGRNHPLVDRCHRGPTLGGEIFTERGSRI